MARSLSEYIKLITNPIMENKLEYIYQADTYCDDCGKDIRKELDQLGKAPNDPDDESSYDSDEYPKGPYSSGEADYEKHCDRCGEALDNEVIVYENKAIYVENVENSDYQFKVYNSDNGKEEKCYFLETAKEIAEAMKEKSGLPIVNKVSGEETLTEAITKQQAIDNAMKKGATVVDINQEAERQKRQIGKTPFKQMIKALNMHPWSNNKDDWTRLAGALVAKSGKMLQEGITDKKGTKQIASVTNRNNVVFNVVYVPTGGLYGASGASVNNNADMVEIYDAEIPHSDFGQFVSRYYVDTFMEISTGLDLEGSVDKWELSSINVNEIQRALIDIQGKTNINETTGTRLKYSTGESMRGYHDIISLATGIVERDTLEKLEDIMRNVIFHSTLDWQTKDQLMDAAKEALAML